MLRQEPGSWFEVRGAAHAKCASCQPERERGKRAELEACALPGSRWVPSWVYLAEASSQGTGDPKDTPPL